MADRKSNLFVTLVFDENTSVGMQVDTECEIKTYIRNGLLNAITGKEIKNFVIDDYEVINAKLKEDSYKGKWIPVSDRLPNHDEYIKNDAMFIVSDGNKTYAEWFDIFKQRFGEATMAGFRVDRAVVAWMSLPDSYNLPKPRQVEKAAEIHCNLTGAEIAQSFIDDVMAVEDLLPRGGKDDSN